ncbi:MAG: helix-turn-helix transcriptional regulator [Firmicutes bacterium]|nr:helix-turn-helix transcriptional regulator [Bacillota bacterium]
MKHCNLSRIENGKTMPSAETLERIAEALGKQVKVSFI